MSTTLPATNPPLKRVFRSAARLWEPQPVRRLRCFEIAFTIQFLLWMGLLFLHPLDWLGEEGFHPDMSLLQRGYWKPWPKLTWWGVWLFGALVATAGGLILSGKWKRLGFFLALLCSVYVQYADPMSAFTLSRLHVVVFLVLWTAPPSFQDAGGRMVQSNSTVNICRLVLICLYFVAGWAKVTYGDWLKHDDVLWTHMLGMYRTEPAAWLLRNVPMWYWAVQKWLALGFELGAPLLFGIPKLRTAAIVLGVGFHFTIAICFWSIWPFALHCVAYYVLFVPDRWLDRLHHIMSGGH